MVGGSIVVAISQETCPLIKSVEEESTSLQVANSKQIVVSALYEYHPQPGEFLQDCKHASLLVDCSE